MRVNQGKAVASFDIRDDHILNQCGFAGSGLAYDVHMASAVLLFDAEAFSYITVVCDGKGGDRILVTALFIHTLIVYSQLI